MSHTVKVHLFPSTEQAWDAIAEGAAIATGDVLLIESERVVGIAHAQPFAVTQKCVALYPTNTLPTVAKENFAAHCCGEYDQAKQHRLLRGIKMARIIADGYGWPVTEWMR